jgi:Flp pilus assembly protein TadD
LLEDEIDRHSAILARYNLLYHFRTGEINPVQSAAREMDDELEQYILQKLAAKMREQAERDRLMVLNQINVARPTVERDLKNLRSRANSMTADEQLSGFLKLVQHLWNMGGHRAAWSTLWHEYDRLKVSVTLGLQFTVAVEISNMMTEDGHSDLAARILHDLHEKAQSLSDLNLRYRFLDALGRAYMRRCAYAQAVATLSSAAQIAPDDRSRALIEAELSEARLLICDFHQFESSMDERKNDY